MAEPIKKPNSKAPPAKKKVAERNGDEVFEAPEITREPSSRQVHLGSKLTLRVMATGKPLPTYQWYLNGRKISGANSDRYNVNKTRREHSGAYTCEIKNYAGKVMTRPAMVSFLVERIPQLVVEPALASIPVGNPFKFRIASPDSTVLKRFKFHWTFNGKRITGANAPELQFLQVKKKYEGEYKVVMLVAGEIYASNCVRLQALAAEAAPEIEPALTKEKTAFIVAPPKAAFFFDPLAEEENEAGDEGNASVNLDQWKLELAQSTSEEEALPKPASIGLARKKAYLEKLLTQWQSKKQAA